MKAKAVPSAWVHRSGLRLDARPFLSGAIEARVIIESGRFRREPLHAVTAGHNGGIFNGPQFSRNYVSPEHGVPFLGSSAMLRADLSGLPHLRKRDAVSPKLSFLRLQPGMTLISCSGTIGRMVYVRPDMDGIWSSQHIMKVVPDPSRIPSGYLYAFLSSKFGIPMVTSGTYGAIIQHIEPEHIADLPVPRLGAEFEHEVHELVERASHLLAAYQSGVNGATGDFFASVGLRDITAEGWHRGGPDVGFEEVFPRVESFRSLNFNPRFKEICNRVRSRDWRPLGKVCEPGTLQRGGRYKRIDASPEHAYRLVGQKHLFWLEPEGRWVARSALGPDVLVEPGSILIAAQGTLGESELYCRAEFAWGPAVDNAYSEHILRVVADENVIYRGCLYAFMRSETAFRMLRSISVGTKLQDHHYAFRPQLPVPLPRRRDQSRIHDTVVRAYNARHAAVGLLRDATGRVENAIEDSA